MLNFNKVTGHRKLFPTENLNTSHVKLQRLLLYNKPITEDDLNTSHVKLQRTDNQDLYSLYPQFKYISC